MNKKFLLGLSVVALLFVALFGLTKTQMNREILHPPAPPLSSSQIPVNPSWCSILPAYQKVSAEDAHRMMREFESSALLDVRTQEEFDAGHIAGAILLPEAQAAEKIEQVIPEKSVVVFVYSSDGQRSAEITHKMVDMGYNHVYDFGGITDWPYETTTTDPVSGVSKEDEWTTSAAC